jgi:hypothetical protein
METNKSTRAIVAGTLDSPGLLASVSREAAQLIGMRPGTVSRVRMVQPSDPIAYLRFIDNLERGIADYDSGSVITEENFRDFIYGDDTYNPSVNTASAEEPPYTPPPQRQVTGPSYVLEPEWRPRAEITDLYGFEPVTPAEPAASAATAQQPQTVTAVITSEDLNKEEIIKDTSEWIEESPREEIAKEVPEYIDTPVYISEAPPVEIEKEVEEKIEEQPREEVAKINPLWEEPVPVRVADDFNIVPSELRPPSSIYGINPEDIIPGIVQRTDPAAQPAAPVQSGFSVPRINELERGKYYVQLAALDTPESVESALRHVDHSFKPVVYMNGDSKYRILLGPLNQGESAAVLQRFKSIGYSDAFVRAAR